MTDVIKGSYSNFEFVKTRGVAKITIEIPLEAAGHALQLLGTPTQNDTAWVAIARLKPDAKSPRVEAQEALLGGVKSDDTGEGPDTEPALEQVIDHRIDLATNPPDTRKPKPRFHELPRSRQAGILCADPAFQNWLDVTAPEDTATIVRKRCGITSRSELDKDDVPADVWDSLVSQFRQDTGQEPEIRG